MTLSEVSKKHLQVIMSIFVWQDFHMLVANPRKQKLLIQVKDSLGFADLTIGSGEVSFSDSSKLGILFN